MKIQVAIGVGIGEAVARSSKKPKNKRSQMLRLVMPLLSRETGEKLADAISQNNVHAVRNIWSQVGNELAKKLEH